MLNDIKTSRKIGRNRGKPRLWIEGKALIDAGFSHGDGWILIEHLTGVDIAHVKLSASPSAAPGETVDGHKVRKIAGTPDRPIVDIAGASLNQLATFGEMPEAVDLTYSPGYGMIRVRCSTSNHHPG